MRLFKYKNLDDFISFECGFIPIQNHGVLKHQLKCLKLRLDSIISPNILQLVTIGANILDSLKPGSRVVFGIPKPAITPPVKMKRQCKIVVHNNATIFTTAKLHLIGVKSVDCSNCGCLTSGSICRKCQTPTGLNGPWTTQAVIVCRCGTIKPDSWHHC